MSGKGSSRRQEDTAKVEANWPTEWNVREAGQVATKGMAVIDNLRDEQLRKANEQFAEDFTAALMGCEHG